jgi:hypothetical protein
MRTRRTVRLPTRSGWCRCADTRSALPPPLQFILRISPSSHLVAWQEDPAAGVYPRYLLTLRRLSSMHPPPSVAAWADIVQGLPGRGRRGRGSFPAEDPEEVSPQPPPQAEAAWDRYPRCEEVDAELLTAAAFERDYVRAS